MNKLAFGFSSGRAMVRQQRQSATIRFGEETPKPSSEFEPSSPTDLPSVEAVPIVWRPTHPSQIVKAQKAAKKAAKKAEKAENKRRREWEQELVKNKEADPAELAKIQKQKALRKAGRHAAMKPAAVSLTVATGSLVGFATTGVPLFLVPLGTSVWAGIQLSGQSYSKAKADMNANYDKYLDHFKKHEAQKMQPQLEFDKKDGLIKRKLKSISKKFKKT